MLCNPSPTSYPSMLSAGSSSMAEATLTMSLEEELQRLYNTTSGTTGTTPRSGSPQTVPSTTGSAILNNLFHQGSTPLRPARQFCRDNDQRLISIIDSVLDLVEDELTDLEDDEDDHNGHDSSSTSES